MYVRWAGSKVHLTAEHIDGPIVKIGGVLLLCGRRKAMLEPAPGRGPNPCRQCANRAGVHAMVFNDNVALAKRRLLA